MRSILSAALCAALLVACSGTPPAGPGEDGALRPCPETPNCVSTEATDSAHAVAPLPFRGSPEEALARARAALLEEPRTRVVAEGPGWLHVEARSRVFRFVDDVHLRVDAPGGVLRFRSASRVGRSDLGVNRARMERFRARFLRADPPAPGP